MHGHRLRDTASFIWVYINMNIAIYGYIFVYIVMYGLKCVFGMSGVVLWMSGLVF